MTTTTDARIADRAQGEAPRQSFRTGTVDVRVAA
jgi:hypothetical protein